jgi:hypothetical protein
MRGRTIATNAVPGTHGAPREADLPGGLSTHYFLCETNTRLLFNSIPALRAHLADVAYALCGDAEFFNADTSALVLRPTLVASLKNCFNPAFPHRARLVFDLDGDDNARLPAVEFVRGCFVEWLTSVFPDHNWQNAQCVIFGGKFDDKPASMHVYFPEYCFAAAESNRFNQHNNLIDRLAAPFVGYGLKIDVSIHTGGLKIPYADKWIKSAHPHYRGFAQQLLLAHNIVIETWLELFNTCDPLVISSDAAYNNELDFPRAAQRVRAEPVVAASVPAAVLIHPIGEIDAVLRRLYDAVPQWNGCPVIRKQARNGQGMQILCPQHAYCPIKGGVHRSEGASFALWRNDNSLLVSCHKADCLRTRPHQIVFTDPLLRDHPVQLNVLERFNASWVILEGSAVARLPQRLADGTFSELKIMSHKQFVDQEKRSTERYCKKSFPQVWLEHPNARRCPFGLVCSPTPVDPRYYNTWMGVRPDVAAMSATFAEVDDAALEAMVPNWLKLVRTNICNNDAEVIKYVFNWMAHCFKLPHIKPGVALVLVGPPGCGKGLTANMIADIYGKPHGVAINAGTLQGDFTSLYSHVCVLVLDEMEKIKGSKIDNSKIKNLVTEPTGVHNEKYVKESVVKMYQHIFMLTNNERMVHVQNNERRYFIQQGSHNLGEPQDPDYLAFVAHIANVEMQSVASLAALYTLLMRRDLTGFVPMLHPTTFAHWRTAYFGMSKPQRFVYRVLASGNITPHNATLTAAQKGQYESLCSDWLVATSQNGRIRGVVGVDAVEMGFGAFDRPAMRYPKVRFIHILLPTAGARNAGPIQRVFVYSRLVPSSHLYMHSQIPPAILLGLHPIVHRIPILAAYLTTPPFVQELMMIGFMQHFPNNKKADESTLWRDGWYKLLPVASWELQRTEVVGGRVQTFMLPSLDELRRKFVAMCGNVDAKIWTPEWMIE